MPYLERYRALSAELQVDIVPGTICEVHPSSSSSSSLDGTKNDGGIEIRNMTYLLSAPDGSVSGSYQKRNLWHPERPHLTAAPSSSAHRAFDSGLTWGSDDGGTPVKVGLLICWDAIFPESFRPLIMTGADIIVVPAFWLLDEDFGEETEEGRRRAREGERRMLDGLVVTRAYENTCTVVFCNAGGASQVAGAGVLKGGGMMGVEEEGVRAVEVDLGEDRRLEGRYKIRMDLKEMAAAEGDRGGSRVEGGKGFRGEVL